MGTSRSVFVLAATLIAVGCATSGGAPTTAAARLTGPGKEEIRFMKHRLVVERDAAGQLTGAKAWDPGEKEIPAHVIPFREVSVCLPNPGGQTAGGASQCEPFSFIPEGTSFKTGANSLCWYFSNGRLVYYAC